jgi:hypothetical protein
MSEDRGSQMDVHHFQELMGWILGKGRTAPDAIAIAIDLTERLTAQPYGRCRRVGPVDAMQRHRRRLGLRLIEAGEVAAGDLTQHGQRLADGAAEFVEIAGDIDIFADRGNPGSAKDRVVTDEEAVAGRRT